MLSCLCSETLSINIWSVVGGGGREREAGGWEGGVCFPHRLKASAAGDL